MLFRRLAHLHGIEQSCVEELSTLAEDVTENLCFHLNRDIQSTNSEAKSVILALCGHPTEQAQQALIRFVRSSSLAHDKRIVDIDVNYKMYREGEALQVLQLSICLLDGHKLDVGILFTGRFRFLPG